MVDFHRSSTSRRAERISSSLSIDQNRSLIEVVPRSFLRSLLNAAEELAPNRRNSESSEEDQTAESSALNGNFPSFSKMGSFE